MTQFKVRRGKLAFIRNAKNAVKTGTNTFAVLCDLQEAETASCDQKHYCTNALAQIEKTIRGHINPNVRLN
jgi:hypothetical protein